MDGERIDADAVEAWRPPVADAATDDDDLDPDDIDDCDPADDEPDFVRDWTDED